MSVRNIALRKKNIVNYRFKGYIYFEIGHNWTVELHGNGIIAKVRARIEISKYSINQELWEATELYLYSW